MRTFQRERVRRWGFLTRMVTKPVRLIRLQSDASLTARRMAVHGTVNSGGSMPTLRQGRFLVHWLFGLPRRTRSHVRRGGTTLMMRWIIGLLLWSISVVPLSWAAPDQTL